MPRGRGKTTIELAVETRNRLSSIARRLNETYDEVLRGLLDMAEFLMSCKLRMKRLLDSVFVEFYRDGKLVFSLSIEQYLRLRRLIKFIPELEGVEEEFEEIPKLKSTFKVIAIEFPRNFMENF